MPTLKIQKADGTFEFLQLAGEEFADIGNQVLDVKSQLVQTVNELDDRGINIIRPPAPLVGAKGDGTDETSIIQTILNISEGMTVIFPFGYSFRITGVLNTLKNTNIFAYGSKIYNNTSHNTILNLEDGCKVYGLEIEGMGNASLNYNGHGIDVKGLNSANYKEGILLEDCHIHKIGGHGVFLQYAKDVNINKCKIENVGYAGIHGLSVTNVTVDKAKVKGIFPGTGVLAYGITFTRVASTTDLVAHPRSKDCNVVHSTIEDNPLWEGLDTHAGENIVFKNNTIKNCRVGIAVTRSANGQGVTDYAPQNCKVIGNTIYGNGTDFGISVAGANSGTDGIATEFGYGNIVNGNTLINCGGNGNSISGAIYLRDTYGLSVVGNTLKDCYAHGINLYKNNRAFSVEGNTIIDTQDSTYATPTGVVVRDQFNFGYIGGNTIFKVNASLNNYVMVRGVFIQASANIDIALGVNLSNANSPLFNSAHNLTNYGNFGNGTAKMFAGNGSPENVITAGVGSIYRQLNGGAGTTFWVKESGSGNTGWIAK